MSTLSSAAAVNQIVLDCDNWTLAEGEEVIAYMNIPAGAQTAFSVEINVVDAEGNAKTVYVQNTKARVNDEDKDADPIYSIASTGLNKTSFKRGTATAVFGLKNKQPKAIEIAEDNLADASGIYVDNEAALLDLIADGRGEIMVHNAGDLVLNSTIADALAENTACYLVFTNPIAIQDFEKTVELTKVTFKDKVTVKDEYEADGTTATEEGTTVVFGEDVNVEAGMEVEAYSTATLEAGKFNAITNKGTLIKYDGANVGNVTSTGALTADCGDAPEAEEEAASRAATAYTLAITIDGGTAKIIGFDPSVTLKGGSLEYEAEYDATAQKNKPLAVNNLTVRRDTDKNATVTIGADVTWTNNVEITELNAIKAATTSGVTSISKKLTVVNNGTITSTKYFRVGNLTNNGVINVTTAGGEYLVIFGEATNNKTINATWVQLHYGSAGLTASGTLTNNGFINGKVFSERNGKIVAKAGSAMTLKNGDSANKKSIARVDNTEGGNLGMSTEDFESTKYVIYHEYSDFNLGDLQKLNTPLFNINTIVVTGVYTVDAKDLDATLTNYSDVINRFEFKNGSSMVVASETTLFTNDNVYVEGEVTFAGWSAEKSKVLLNGSELTVAKNSVLTLRNITLDGYDASHKMELTYGAAVATTDKAGKIEKEGNAVLGQNVSND